jgi:hypothetical protein
MTSLLASHQNVARQSATVAPPAWRWVLKPSNGQGFLLIGETLYCVTDEAFEYENGMGGRLWRLKKSDGTVYQLTMDAEGDLQCDCPDATYRQRTCRHCIAIREAFAALDSSARLARWFELMSLTPMELAQRRANAPF